MTRRAARFDGEARLSDVQKAERAMSLVGASPPVTASLRLRQRGQTRMGDESSDRINRDLLPRVRLPFVLHDARNEGKQREVAAGANVFPGVNG